MDLIRSQKSFAAGLFAELDLTVQLALALHLIAREGTTMRALAFEMACDASNATGIVDRLERRGLIERRADPADRRVKRVVLTAAGRRMREKVEERLRVAPPAIAALSPGDQRMLREILERALGNAEAQRLERGA